MWQTDRETDRWTDRWTHILSRHSPRYAYASRGNTSGGSVLTLFHKVAWFIYSCSSPLPVIFFILTTFSIHYSITFPLQDEIVPFLQILPTITDFWYLLTVFTDHWTGPDLSHSSAYFLVYFVLIFCGRLSWLPASFRLLCGGRKNSVYDFNSFCWWLLWYSQMRHIAMNCARKLTDSAPS